MNQINPTANPAFFTYPVAPVKEKTLVIGAGEIGKSLGHVLDRAYEVHFHDPKKEMVLKDGKKFRVMNICYPYSPGFIKTTKEYIDLFQPELVIIHSTIKPGTTRKIGKMAVHSPVNGKHPNLANSILNFIKFVGGQSPATSFAAVEFLQRAGIKTQVMASPETTELAKILCTTQYGWFIVLMKEIMRLCEEYKVPFHEVYTEWNNAYNNGYLSMGEMRFSRPTLFPSEGPIGGHCVVPNCDLIDDFLTNLVKERDQKYGRKS